MTQQQKIEKFKRVVAANQNYTTNNAADLMRDILTTMSLLNEDNAEKIAGNLIDSIERTIKRLETFKRMIEEEAEGFKRD